QRNEIVFARSQAIWQQRRRTVPLLAGLQWSSLLLSVTIRTMKEEVLNNSETTQKP
ncbi:hypothetical protein J6590_033099, partial [Homalodisca vitripennis]